MSNQHQSITEGLAVELYLDPVSEEKVRKFRDIIYNEGIQPVQGLMADKPHVSLAVFPKTQADRVIALTAEFARSVHRFGFRLGAVGTFPTTDNVLFLYPVPSVTLLNVHADFHKLIHEAGIECSRYYYPGSWVPHLTLEFDISSDELCRSIRIFKENFRPITGEFIQLGVVRFRPIEYMDHFDLKEEN